MPMRSNPDFMKRVRAVLVVFVLQALAMAATAEILNIAGSSVVNLPVADIAQILREERNMEIHINTNGGSNAGLQALGGRSAQIAMTSRPLTPEDRAGAPEVTFNEIYIGEQVVALGVARDVWDAGVQALTREQLKGIYEKQYTNWKQLGGPDEKIAFFNFNEGRGIWEMFVQWLYDDAKKAPTGDFPKVGTHEEARDTVEFTRGSLSILSPLYIGGRDIRALELKEEKSSPAIGPTIENIAAHKYPISRPLYLVVDDKPTRGVKILVDLMLGERGQALMKKYGYFSAHALSGAKPAPEVAD